MAGNVWEWTDDWYVAYPGNVIANPNYGMIYRVLRGGAWDNSEDVLRSSDRTRSNPDSSYVSYDYIGFRCSRSP